VLVVVGAVAPLSVSAAVAGPPRSALGSVSIPLPSKGKAGFAVVTVTGKLVLGVTDPALTLSSTVDPRKLPVTVQAGGGATKPTTKNGVTTVQLYVWIKNAGAQAPKQTLDLAVIGAHALWAAGPLVQEKSLNCGALSKLRYTAYFHYAGAPSAREILVGARRAAGCTT
jgi:hypothetical protein